MGNKYVYLRSIVPATKSRLMHKSGERSFDKYDLKIGFWSKFRYLKDCVEDELEYG